MANTLHNPTFKRPHAVPPPPLGSRSPPRPLVEPLSPRQPVVLEPRFNYPALNDNIDFTVRPESAYVSTPRARAYSTSHKSTHQRTPSTIDTLAEAALAASPSYQDGTKRHPVLDTDGYTQAHPQQTLHGGNEPPHKRARSELLPSPFVEQYASRPATSYEPNQAWVGNALPGQGYHSRVEEAALLLNLKSGGGPTIPPTNLSLPPPPGTRPHANSFPQAAFQSRPLDIPVQPPHPLLPPFNPQDGRQPMPTLPSPQKTNSDDDSRPQFSPITPNEVVDVDMMDSKANVYANNTKLQPSQTHTPPDEVSSPAPSADAATSEATASEVPEAPKRRGWPKGKPRGTGARKTLAEKAASKRAASRKKPSDPKSSKRKSGPDVSDSASVVATRRKSLSDTFVFGELDSANKEPIMHSRAQSVPPDTPMLIREASPSKVLRRRVTVKPDTICAGCETARQTTTSHGELDEWISCNGCKNWFHIDCAGFKKAHEVRDVDKFFCAACEPEHGKTTYVRKSTRAHASVDYAELQRGVLKTSEESVEHHYIQPIKDGTFTFDDETFPRMRPEMVTKEFFERSGTFVEPICIPAEWNPRPWEKSSNTDSHHAAQDSMDLDDDEMQDLQLEQFEYDNTPDLGQDKLDMIMPEGLTVRQVCNLVGPDWPIDVIDVKTQNSGAKWTLSRWADYYEEVGEEKAIRNVISLEVSQTKLGRILQRPKVVRDIDLQDDVWPQEEIEKGKFPKVQFYCLMSVADSYTDFHIDFGGSSVYYHILRGKKTFFFIPPKPKHLKAYEEWNDSPQQNYTFLPSITKECYRVDLSEGDTMLIPSGWIHAVWTPEDSLVIGGNFLNRMSFKNQFRVVEIEKVNETPMKFRYPFFQKIMWYTVIKYLTDDPLPDAVSQTFYEGRKFEREAPLWADFDGEIAARDPRPGSHNARYYSQAEIDGLPDLVNYIFRTVMLVMGRIEGTTADRMKRVNASIPKTHGEPLDLAKTFALWVAWKRGNEDPPAWAHPDAVLPSSKEEGPPKKLSERKLKELERKEAIAAWRIAPDRQSARVMKIAKEAAAFNDSNGDNGGARSSPAPAKMQHPYQNATYGQMGQRPAFVMANSPGQVVSTPKTSVLGPKRVACDACRKRRIRCKHKDQVMQTTPNSRSFDGSASSAQAPRSSDVHENITVTPTKLREQSNFMGTVMDGQPNGYHGQDYVYDQNGFTGTPQSLGSGGRSMSKTYVDSNAPLAMNGVSIYSDVLNGVSGYSDVPKRGRSKACFECRKSKRRCIHDENGNVDPVKASETPVPRGSISSKKRTFVEDGGALLAAEQQQQQSAEQETAPLQHPPAPTMQGHGVLKPQNTFMLQPKKFDNPAQQSQPTAQHSTRENGTPQVDPSLFSMYPKPQDGTSYGASNYLYPAREQAPAISGPPPDSYVIPSLEQIANEVLVDMNGNEYTDPGFGAQQSNGVGQAVQPLPNGYSKTEESVDSAVSLPRIESLEQSSPGSAMPNGVGAPDANDVETRLAMALAESRTVVAEPSVETNGIAVAEQSLPPPTTTEKSPELPTSSTDNIPFYHLPAAPSQSPESTKREPAMPNGMPNGKSASPPTTGSWSNKRKRDSTSSTSGSNKVSRKLKLGSEDPQQGNGSPLTEEEKQSLELAKMLQQEELGLRRRSK